jgi:hypothetical protein
VGLPKHVLPSCVCFHRHAEQWMAKVSPTHHSMMCC